MTVYEFEKRASYRGGYDRILGHWKILDIHLIPKQFRKETEVDFYCCNDKIVCLLRFRKRAKIAYHTNYDNTSQLHYWIAELPICTIKETLIRETLAHFENAVEK